MSSCDIIFGVLKRPEQPSIRSLLIWEAEESIVRGKRKNPEEWLTETQDAYKEYKEPLSQEKPAIDLNASNPQSECNFIISEELPSNDKNKSISLKNKKKSSSSMSLESRNLPNSAFSNKFKKPVFAHYGQGNLNSKNRQLFSKGHMKTFNVLPYSKEKKLDSVYQTAKIASSIRKNSSQSEKKKSCQDYF